MAFGIGRPWPLGSSLIEGGVNFSVAAPGATKLELLVFDHPDDGEPSRVIPLNASHHSGDYWHVAVEGVGLGSHYGYRVFGPVSPWGHGFNPAKVLLDPCARAISGWNAYQRELATGDQPNTAACLKAVVTERDRFNFEKYPRPRHPWKRTVIYELHPGGFTKDVHSPAKPEHRGSFLGLIDAIPYLKSLGVTSIELLPPMAFDPHDAPAGRLNYWGYSPLSWFAPHHDYVMGDDPLAGRQQLRQFVQACHSAGLEVFVDVVYNHTTEGNANGPTLSWRGFADRTYYLQTSDGKYQDVSGCGNSIAANRPLVRQLILESMRCWALELGVDGFRFDLGAALTRGENLTPLDHPPLFEAMESDPELADIKLVGEPWDCGGLYRLGNFPAQRVGTWNGRFRDDLRRFWKGDENTAWNLAERLSGSPDLFGGKPASNGRSINFVTAHDGFTLHDLVSYNDKHNLANGEDNRDGDPHNNSWNHGVEGPSTDKAINALRERQMRNIMATLLLAPGVPMLLMGDETNRSQGGNNNCWCQDNPLGWMHWGNEQDAVALRTFQRRLLSLRLQLQELLNPDKPLLQEANEAQPWREWHGVEHQNPDWASWSHCFAWSLHTPEQGPRLWCGMNAYFKALHFDLPASTSGWRRVIDTGLPPDDDLPAEPPIWKPPSAPMESRSLMLLVAGDMQLKL
jgi:glycogen operon protein